MGRVVVDWGEDVETLRTLYLSEKDHQDRTRLQALWYLRQGHTINETCERIGKSSRTIQNWIAWYRLGGVEEVLGRRHGGSRNGGRRLSPEQEQDLKEQAEQGKIRTIWDGVHWSQEQGVKYRYGGMRKVFDRLKLRKKMPRPRNPKANIPQQEWWKKGGYRRN
jgi:transposase